MKYNGQRGGSRLGPRGKQQRRQDAESKSQRNDAFFARGGLTSDFKLADVPVTLGSLSLVRESEQTYP